MSLWCAACPANVVCSVCQNLTELRFTILGWSFCAACVSTQLALSLHGFLKAQWSSTLRLLRFNLKLQITTPVLFLSSLSVDFIWLCPGLTPLHSSLSNGLCCGRLDAFRLLPARKSSWESFRHVVSTGASTGTARSLQALFKKFRLQVCICKCECRWPAVSRRQPFES